MKKYLKRTLKNSILCGLTLATMFIATSCVPDKIERNNPIDPGADNFTQRVEPGDGSTTNGGGSTTNGGGDTPTGFTITYNGNGHTSGTPPTHTNV